MAVVQDLNQSYRLQAAEELKRLRAEQPGAADKWDMSKEQIDALSDEEFTRIFFQKAKNTSDADIDALFSKVAFEVWKGNRKSTDSIFVGRTPEVLKLLGAEDLPLMIAPKVINEKHRFPFKIIENLPAELRNPLMIFDSATEKGSFVVVTGMIYEKKPIIAAIHLRKQERHHYVNKIASVYDKGLTGIEGWIKEGLLKYWDEERAKEWFLSAGLQLPGEETATPSNKNILSKTDLVKYEQNARGRISFGPEGVNIALLKNADLSTFLHETGHLYLEVLGDLAESESAPQDIKDDYNTILEWLGVKSRAEIKTEHHEQWARGFEAYLREGKTPSSKLRAAFAKFRAWLLKVYENLKKLDMELTPEVRNVMDRLLATQEEIEAAQAEQGMFPLFKDPKAVGMSEEAATRYSEAISEARQASEEAVDVRLFPTLL